MIRLIIVDDHPVIINGIVALLEGESGIELIREFSSGKELIDFLQGADADVILLDINMPDINGLDACRWIKENKPEIAVLAFSQYNEKRFVRRMLKCGANGYLLKNSSASEILTAITMVFNGGIYLSAELPNVFEERKAPSAANALFPDISSRELDVLKLICTELNTQEIADTLFISKHTVETHRANLLQKVGVKNTAGLVKWAVENEIV